MKKIMSEMYDFVEILAVGITVILAIAMANPMV